jgi:hypothetical protein
MEAPSLSSQALKTLTTLLNSLTTLSLTAALSISSSMVEQVTAVQASEGAQAEVATEDPLPTRFSLSREQPTFEIL